MKTKPYVKGIVCLSTITLLLLSGIVISAEEQRWNQETDDGLEVRLYIGGGLGINGTVINNGQKTLTGTLHVIYYPGQEEFRSLTIPPEKAQSVRVFHLTVFRPIGVTLTAGGQTLHRGGFIVGPLVIFLPG